MCVPQVLQECTTQPVEPLGAKLEHGSHLSVEDMQPIHSVDDLCKSSEGYRRSGLPFGVVSHK